jgi:hypothetical protein
MKKLFSLSLFLMITFLVVSQNWTTVNVAAPGKLSTQMPDYYTSLKLTGSIDARDVKYMRDNLTKLIALDLSAVTIVAYTGTGGTYAPVSVFYPANEMPQFSFYDSYSTYASKTTLKTIILPNSLTSIGMYSFDGCTGLTSIIIPSLVVSIGGYAFYNCSGLTGSLIIPSTITTIEIHSFTLCQGLTSIVIPSSVTAISYNAFSSCSGLTSITSFCKVPADLPALSDAFMGIDKAKCTLYVPIGSKSSYKSAYQWKDFQNIVEMTTAVPTIVDEKIKIYPNPITEGFKIDGIDGKASIKLIDKDGRVFFSKSVVGDEYIPMNGIPSGVYVLVITITSEIVTRKIIKT